MTAMQEKLNRQGQAYIAGLAATAKVLWRKACEADDMPPDTKFAAFSKDNKYAKFYNITMTQFMEARQQYADGGYVGLTTTRRT